MTSSEVQRETYDVQPKICGNILLGIAVVLNDNIGMPKNEAFVW